MGLFGAILNGLGLEEESRQNSYIKPRRKEYVNEQNKYNEFNLHQKKLKDEFVMNKVATNTTTTTFHPQNSNLAIFAPKTHAEVQKIVLSLKLEQSCIVNLEYINDDDRLRILDFFSGAVFALGGDITRVQGDLFLVTPKTVNIKLN